MLTDLDWLGPNLNHKKYDDPEAIFEKYSREGPQHCRRPNMFDAGAAGEGLRLVHRRGNGRGSCNLTCRNRQGCPRPGPFRSFVRRDMLNARPAQQNSRLRSVSSCWTRASFQLGLIFITCRYLLAMSSVTYSCIWILFVVLRALGVGGGEGWWWGGFGLLRAVHHATM